MFLRSLILWIQIPNVLPAVTSPQYLFHICTFASIRSSTLPSSIQSKQFCYEWFSARFPRKLLTMSLVPEWVDDDLCLLDMNYLTLDLPFSKQTNATSWWKSTRKFNYKTKNVFPSINLMLFTMTGARTCVSPKCLICRFSKINCLLIWNITFVCAAYTGLIALLVRSKNA